MSLYNIHIMPFRFTVRDIWFDYISMEGPTHIFWSFEHKMTYVTDTWRDLLLIYENYRPKTSYIPLLIMAQQNKSNEVYGAVLQERKQEMVKRYDKRDNEISRYKCEETVTNCYCHRDAVVKYWGKKQYSG